MSDCFTACEDMNTPNNKYDVLISELQQEIKEICETQGAKFLMYDEKVSELCAYIKNNLSNSLRCLLLDMKNAKELDEIINDIVLSEIKTMMIDISDLKDKTAGFVIPQMFGAIGDGLHDDTEAFKKAIQECGNNELYIPKTEKSYKITSLVIENIPKIKIEGILDVADSIEIKEDINSTERPDISIYKVKGTLKLKGINTCKVRIGKCDTLELISNDRSEFIGYTYFELGDVINLIIKTSGTGWINENIFTGGRLTNVNINGEMSPEDNLFIKPMFENATVDINKGYRNRFVNCRFEGKNNINLGAETYGNYFEKTFFTAPQLMYAKFQDYDINFNDLGDNILIRETGTKSVNLISLNKFNNPYNLPIVDDRIEPAGSWTRLFISDIVPLPKNIFGLEFINPSKNVGIELRFYDGNKNLLNKTDSIKTTQLACYNGVYSLGDPGVSKVMATIYPNKSAKYMSITITGCGAKMSIDNLEVRISHKENDLIQAFIDGFKTPIEQ